MKRWIWLCGAVLVFAGVVSAQDGPTVELFGGYTYLRVNPGFSQPGINFNGGSGSVSYNLHPWLGLVGDFGGYHWSTTGADATVLTYLFGPKIAFRRGPITPFVHTLFGGAHGSGAVGGICPGARIRTAGSVGVGGGGGCSASAGENAFSMAMGGGLDWNVTSHIGVRVAEAEYLMTRFASETQNNVRVSGGIVFRW
jgi:opacity protein-like surface antigen